MGKYLDKTGLQYFYNKLKEKFADKTTIENKLNSLTGALTWKGELSALPATTNYTAGNVIKVGTKEYVLTESNGTKTWDELGDEGSYLLKTTAEETYLKKANGEVKTANLADGSVTKAKLATDVQTSLGKADNSLQIGEENIGTDTYTTLINSYISIRAEDSADYDDGGIRLAANLIEFYANKTNNKRAILKASDDKTISIGYYNDSDSSISGGTLTGLDAPTSDTDAANKAYVDGKVEDTVQTTTQSLTEEQKNIVRSNIGAESCVYIDLSDPEIADVWDDTFTQGDFCMRTENAISDTYKDKRLRVLSFIKSKLPFESDGEGHSYYTQFYNPNFYVYLLIHEEGISVPILCDILGNGVDSIYCCTFPPACSCRMDVDEDHFVRSDNDLYYYMPFNAGGSGPNAGAVAYGYYNMNTGDVFYAQTSGELIFRTLKPLYLTSDYEDAFTYTDEDKATGREILNVPDKTSLATSLQAITIYTDNTTEHKAQNLANIKAYEDNLKAMGVDTAKDNHIPIAISGTIQKGFLVGNTTTNRYQGMMGQDNQWYACVVALDGTFASIRVLTGYTTQLNTTNKTSTIDAINEVNTLAKSKASTDVATSSANGLMSSADKTKLTGIADGATRIIGVVVNGATKTAANGLLNIGTVLTTVDGTINAASNNPVSNSAVASALNGKVSKTGLMTINNQAITGGGNINVATEKVTLAYNPDDSYMTGEQYRNIFTDAYESGKIPNVELVYTAEGDYEVLSLKRIDKDDAYYHLYFSSSSIEDNINVYAYGVRVDVLREDDSTAADHDMNCTELQSTSFQSIAKDVVNKKDAAEICTTSTVNTTLTTATKNNFIIMPTVGTANFRLLSYPTDGYTLTFTIVGTATSFALNTASSTQPIYNVSNGATATRYTNPTATRCKIISTYSTALKQWITYRQSIA